MVSGGILARGTRVGDFVVDALIGMGAMGHVYRAHQANVDRPVALKVLAPALVADEEFVRRFRREALNMAELEHPSIVTVYAAGESDGRLYLATRLVPGPNLEQLLRERAPLPPSEVVDILRPLADGLDHAHSRGVVHRDIKPANILLDTDGQPFIADFGISRALGSATSTATGRQPGTPRYMAPEQAGSEPVGHRADLYALACVAFEMLTGSPPYTETDIVRLALAHASRPIPLATALEPTLPPSVDRVLARGLAKNPLDRFPSARSFVDALAAAVDDRPAGRRAGPTRRTVVLAGLGAAALLVGGGTAALVRSRGQAPAPPAVVPPPAPASVVRISAGGYHNLALLSDGTVKAWGDNSEGELGDGTTTFRRTVPATVSGLTGVTAVHAGVWHSLALLGDGTVRAWGANQFGQLGDGTTNDRLTPVTVPGLAGVVGLAVAGFSGTDGRNSNVRYAHSLAVLRDGTVVAWGSNNDGQLGDGTTTDRSTPVPVPGLSGVTAVAAGATHSLALLADGTVRAWGDNGLRGESGEDNAARSARTAPVVVPGLTGVTAVAAGCFHSMALLGDGTVRTWGWNGFGQLGDGTTTDHADPVAVTDLNGVAGVAAGDRFSLATRADGRVRTWGANERYQLGDGSGRDHNAPVDVAALTDVAAASASFLHCLALSRDGTVWAWGLNNDGHLGIGTSQNQATPAVVSALAR